MYFLLLHLESSCITSYPPRISRAVLRYYIPCAVASRSHSMSWIFYEMPALTVGIINVHWRSIAQAVFPSTVLSVVYILHTQIHVCVGGHRETRLLLYKLLPPNTCAPLYIRGEKNVYDFVREMFCVFCIG